MTRPGAFVFPALGLPEDHEAMTVFRETSLKALNPHQAAGMRTFAKALYGLVHGDRDDVPGVRRPRPHGYLAAVALDLRFNAVLLRTAAMNFSALAPGPERPASVRDHAAWVKNLATTLESKAEAWKAPDRQ